LKIRGIDTLEFGLEIENYKENFENLLENLKDRKKEGQETCKEQSLFLNEINFIVAKSGAPFYAYRIECKDFFIYFQEKVMKDNPPIKVKFLSTFLWSYGYKEAYARFLVWFDQFNVKVKDTKVSRIDMCADTEEISFCEYDIKGLCTRAKSRQKHFVDSINYSGKSFSGFTIGRGDPLLARIYNKSLEIKSSHKIWFKELWEKNDWDMETDVWRIEFQMRRKLLKEFKIYTVDDFFEKEDSVWSYLTQKWLLLKNENNDNPSRWKMKRKWKLIQDIDSKIEVAPLIREQVKIGNIKMLLDQASGIMLSIGALCDHEGINETQRVLNTWTKLVLDKKQTSFQSEKERRRKKFY
jgi:hypothetical protein